MRNRLPVKEGPVIFGVVWAEICVFAPWADWLALPGAVIALVLSLVFVAERSGQS
jgi:hypothetical protein